MRNNIKKILTAWLCVVIFATIFFMAVNVSVNAQGQIKNIEQSLYTTHDPIYINGNADFTAENGVSNPDAAGTAIDQYIIEGWDINASSTHGIEIRNTDAYFIIRNCYVHNGGYYYNGIYFNNVQNGRIENTISSNNYHGIYLWKSSNNNIYNNNANSNKVDGTRLAFSSNNNIYNNSANSNNCFGINLGDSNSNNVSNNNASNNGGGIYLYSSSYNNISNNSANSGDYGVFLAYSSYNTISNNVASNNWEGGIMVILSSRYNSISNNSVTSTYHYGIYLEDSSYNNISNNSVSNNGCGISLWESSNNNNIFNNNFNSNNWDGIELLYSSNNNIIINCNVSSNRGHGISLCDSLNNDITNCNVVDNGINGINLQFSTAIIDGNTILNNGWIKVPSWYYPAIFCYESSPTITNNTISGNAWAAVECQYSSPLIDTNIITANYFHGLYFKYYCSPIIRNNEINDNWVGVWLVSSTDSIIEGNTISNNLCGIYFHIGCSNNKIFHNNFIGNTFQAYAYGVNQWDDEYPSGGNYWSDYTGVDEKSGPNQDQPGSDGIGDSPYNIPGGSNSDRYPLMSPWWKPKGPEISVEKEFIPSEITTMSQGVVSAINITNIGDVNITSMDIIDEYVDNMRPNDPAELLVTITSNEGEIYAIMPDDLDITFTENNITISFELPLEVVPVFWENGKLQLGEELCYLESIPEDWVVGVQYLLYPATELEIGTYYADATVTAYSKAGESTKETATGVLTVSLPIELAFPTN